MFRAPFQLPLREGTEPFPRTITPPPVVRTEINADITSATQLMGAMLEVAANLLQQGGVSPDDVVIERGGAHTPSLIDGDVPPPRPEFDAQYALGAATQLTDAAMDVAHDATHFIEGIPDLAAEQIARYDPAVSQFINSQRQMTQSGISPSQRTRMRVPGLSAEYTNLQGAETIRLEVSIPMEHRRPPRPAHGRLKLPGEYNPYLDLIAVNFLAGDA